MRVSYDERKSTTESSASSRSDFSVALLYLSLTLRLRSIFMSSLFAGQPEMKKRPSSRASKTDWKRIRAMKDKDIKLTPEHPELDVRHIVRGIVRRGLKPVPPKASIALRMDADVLEWFKAQGPGYQTRINAVLRAFRDASL
jgi:uncharacterized protein (DUF4415 family)